MFRAEHWYSNHRRLLTVLPIRLPAFAIGGALALARLDRCRRLLTVAAPDGTVCYRWRTRPGAVEPLPPFADGGCVRWHRLLSVVSSPWRGRTVATVGWR
jgi:hypothetical protein